MTGVVSLPELYHLLKLAHILGAAVLFGTGTGIAFFMLMAHRSGNLSAIAPTATIVVIADAVFTASAVVVQPVTGIGLAYVAGYSLLESWIVVSVALYLFIGLCWLPVLWLQKRMRDLALAALQSGTPMPADYSRYFR
jgi:uncharacterized membrane protein